MCTGATSPHWIDRANLNDMLERERDSPENKPQNIWSISTQTFEQNHQVQHGPSQSISAMTTNPVDIPSASSPPQSPTSPGGRGGIAQNGTVSSFGVAVENRSRVVGGGGEGTTSTGATCSSPTAVAGSSSGLPGSVKPNRTAPPPPKARKKPKGRSNTVESDQEPTPYVYPMQKLMQRLKQHREPQRERDPGATAQTGGNQSHEYAQPHVHLHNNMQQHDGIKHTSVTSNNPKKEKYQPIDPKLKQPVGQYQDLLGNNLSRGQSLPTMSTFATLS